MDKYTGTKEVLAKSMNRLAYSQYRGWDLPSNEDGNDEGYLVEYIDGGQANHSDHNGYISWSPKDVFERAYKPSGSFLDRLQIEQEQLNDRFTKLHAFINEEGGAFASLSEQKQKLLRRQRSVMCDYMEVLDERIQLEQTQA